MAVLRPGALLHQGPARQPPPSPPAPLQCPDVDPHVRPAGVGRGVFMLGGSYCVRLLCVERPLPLPLFGRSMLLRTYTVTQNSAQSYDTCVAHDPRLETATTLDCARATCRCARPRRHDCHVSCPSSSAVTRVSSTQTKRERATWTKNGSASGKVRDVSTVSLLQGRPALPSFAVPRPRRAARAAYIFMTSYEQGTG
jgi:hypothetical protein